MFYNNCYTGFKMPRILSRKRKREFCGGWENQRQFLHKKPALEEQPQNQVEPRPSSPIPEASFESKQSSSSKKIGPNLDKYSMYRNDEGCNDFVNLQSLNQLFQQIAVCVKCRGPLTISTGTRHGLQVTITVKCSRPKCCYEVSDKNSPSSPTSKHSEVNVRLAYAFRCIGKGEGAAKTFCALMNLPSPPAFKYYANLLCTTAKEVCGESMKQAVEESIAENDGDSDLTVM